MKNCISKLLNITSYNKRLELSTRNQVNNTTYYKKLAKIKQNILLILTEAHYASSRTENGTHVKYD
jgi:hypothetical protein